MLYHFVYTVLQKCPKNQPGSLILENFPKIQQEAWLTHTVSHSQPVLPTALHPCISTRHILKIHETTIPNPLYWACTDIFFLAFISQTTQCNKYLHSIYCVFRILSHLEMIWSILDGMGRFHANTMSLYTYINDLCIHGFRYLWGCPEPNPLQRPKEVFFRF